MGLVLRRRATPIIDLEGAGGAEPVGKRRAQLASEAAWAGRSGRTRIDGHRPKSLDLGLTLVSSSRAGLQFRLGLGPGLTHHNSESGLAGKPCLLVKSKLLDHIRATFR